MAEHAPSRCLRRQSGFSLIETMVSMIIFSIGLLGLGAVIPVLKSDLTRSDQRTRSTFLAQETAEWLHALEYDADELTVGSHDDPGFAEPHFTRTWTVVDNDPIPRVKRVTIQVIRELQPAESASIVFLHAEAGR